MFKVPEKHRITLLQSDALGSDSSYGNNGAFRIFKKGFTVFCIASDGDNWEHVSVSIVIPQKKGESKFRLPSWNEMNSIKNLFWDEEDCVMQLHPPKSNYVNNNEYTLHLWRPIGQEIPQPPKYMV